MKNSNLKKSGESSANWFSIKDLFINKNKIFVSFTDEIKMIVGIPV